jgi:hypothetical protein
MDLSVALSGHFTQKGGCDDEYRHALTSARKQQENTLPEISARFFPFAIPGWRRSSPL